MLSSRPRERNERVEGSIRLAKLAQDEPMGRIRVGGQSSRLCVLVFATRVGGRRWLLEKWAALATGRAAGGGRYTTKVE